MCPSLICPPLLVPFTRMYSPKPSLRLWRRSGCAWRGLGGSCLGRCHQVFVWEWDEPEVCWEFLDEVALGLLLDTQLFPADRSLWTLKHSVVISPSWLSPFSKSKSSPSVFRLSMVLLIEDAALVWLLKVMFSFPESFSREFFHFLRQKPTPWFHLRASLSPSPWPAVAATPSAQLLNEGSAESGYSWDWQSKRSYDNAVTSTGHKKTEPECNDPIMKNFSFQLAYLGHCGLKMENKQLGSPDCSANWNLRVCDGFDMIHVTWEPGGTWTWGITEGCVCEE